MKMAMKRFLAYFGSILDQRSTRQLFPRLNHFKVTHCDRTAQEGNTSVRATVSSFRHEHKMHSLAVKIISLVSLFALTFISGIIPIKLRSGRGLNDVDRRQEESRDRRRRQFISLCTCFAGGAFFASSMLGLLPVVQREFRDLLDEAMIKTKFPVPEFSVSVGFFLILIVEQIIHVLKEKPVKCHSEVCSEDSRSPLLENSFGKDTFTGASFVKHGKKENITNRENTEWESGESDEEEIVNLHRHHHAHHHHGDGDAGDFDHTSIGNHINRNLAGYPSQHTHPDGHGNDHEDFDHHDHHHDHHRDGDVDDLDNHDNQSPRAYQSQHIRNDPHDASNDHKDVDHHHNHHRDGDARDLHHNHTSIGNHVNQNPDGYHSSHALQDNHDNDHKEDSDHHHPHHHDYHKAGDAGDLDHSSIGNHVNENPGGYQSQHIHPDDHRNDHEDFDYHHDHHRDSDAGDLDHSFIGNHVNQNPDDHQSSHTHSDDHNNDHEEHHHHDDCIFENTNTKHHNKRHYLRSYLLLIALSIHSLFEGLAVGLFQNVDSMVQLLGPLIIHKCILGFSMGVNLVQHCFPSSMIAKSSFLFAAMSPIGLGLGILMLIYTSAELGHTFSAIFQAIATGTFLYVTFFEIFFHELNSQECHKLLKAFMMILGFGLTTVIQFFSTPT